MNITVELTPTVVGAVRSKPPGAGDDAASLTSGLVAAQFQALVDGQSAATGVALAALEAASSRAGYAPRAAVRRGDEDPQRGPAGVDDPDEVEGLATLGLLFGLPVPPVFVDRTALAAPATIATPVVSAADGAAGELTAADTTVAATPLSAERAPKPQEQPTAAPDPANVFETTVTRSDARPQPTGREPAPAASNGPPVATAAGRVLARALRALTPDVPRVTPAAAPPLPLLPAAAAAHMSSAVEGAPLTNQGDDVIAVALPVATVVNAAVRGEAQAVTVTAAPSPDALIAKQVARGKSPTETGTIAAPPKTTVAPDDGRAKPQADAGTVIAPPRAVVAQAAIRGEAQTPTETAVALPDAAVAQAAARGKPQAETETAAASADAAGTKAAAHGKPRAAAETTAATYRFSVAARTTDVQRAGASADASRGQSGVAESGIGVARLAGSTRTGEVAVDVRLAPAPLAARTEGIAVPAAPAPEQVSIRLAAPVAVPDTAHSGTVADQIVRAIRIQVRDGIGEARLRLRPEHLGEIYIELKIDGDRVSAILQVERPDVRAQIEAQSQTLRAGLAAQGLHLDELSVREDGQSREEEQRGGQQPPPDRRRRQSPPKAFALDDE